MSGAGAASSDHEYEENVFVFQRCFQLDMLNTGSNIPGFSREFLGLKKMSPEELSVFSACFKSLLNWSRLCSLQFVVTVMSNFYDNWWSIQHSFDNTPLFRIQARVSFYHYALLACCLEDKFLVSLPGVDEETSHIARELSLKKQLRESIMRLGVIEEGEKVKEQLFASYALFKESGVRVPLEFSRHMDAYTAFFAEYFSHPLEWLDWGANIADRKQFERHGCTLHGRGMYTNVWRSGAVVYRQARRDTGSEDTPKRRLRLLRREMPERAEEVRLVEVAGFNVIQVPLVPEVVSDANLARRQIEDFLSGSMVLDPCNDNARTFIPGGSPVFVDPDMRFTFPAAAGERSPSPGSHQLWCLLGEQFLEGTYYRLNLSDYDRYPDGDPRSFIKTAKVTETLLHLQILFGHDFVKTQMSDLITQVSFLEHLHQEWVIGQSRRDKKPSVTPRDKAEAIKQIYRSALLVGSFSGLQSGFGASELIAGMSLDFTSDQTSLDCRLQLALLITMLIGNVSAEVPSLKLKITLGFLMSAKLKLSKLSAYFQRVVEIARVSIESSALLVSLEPAFEKMALTLGSVSESKGECGPPKTGNTYSFRPVESLGVSVLSAGAAAGPQVS